MSKYDVLKSKPYYDIEHKFLGQWFTTLCAHTFWGYDLLFEGMQGEAVSMRGNVYSYYSIVAFGKPISINKNKGVIELKYVNHFFYYFARILKTLIFFYQYI